MLLFFSLLSCVQSTLCPWTVAHQALRPTVSWNLLKFMSTELLVLSNHLIFYGPLLLLPSIFFSIMVFSNESAFLHMLAKVLKLLLQYQYFR